MVVVVVVVVVAIAVEACRMRMSLRSWKEEGWKEVLSLRRNVVFV